MNPEQASQQPVVARLMDLVDELTDAYRTGEPYSTRCDARIALQAAIVKVLADERERCAAIIEAAKDLYNITFADSEVIVRPPSVAKRDLIVKACWMFAQALKELK